MAIDHELREAAIIGQLREIARIDAAELTGDERRVLRTDPQAQQCAGIPDYGIDDCLIRLRKVLVAGEVWTLTPARTKTGREHRVPLTPETLKIIQAARERSPNEYLFPALKAKPISDMAMSAFMKREGYEARPHGFRATFRTWVEEQTDTPYEVKEAALGHMVDAGVVGAYQRSDRLEKRRSLIEQWESWLRSKRQP